MSKFRRQNTSTSIRGKTISQPIPFPEDDEFPIRTPGTGIALPLGAEAEHQIHMRDSVAAQLENTSHQTGIAVSDFIDPGAVAPAAPMPSRPPPEVPIRRSDVPTPLRNSTLSKNTESTGRPQRKKSTMRAVFGRLFGRRRKGSGSSSPVKQGSSEQRSNQHRSDPTALNRSPPASSQKRSASLPINEFNRALRSHSVIADDFPLGSTENETNRESIQADGQRRPRRATTPSRLWTPNKTPGYVDWTGLSPRPASTHGRGSRMGAEGLAENIGTAVTSSSHPNRRSRSLGELRDVVASQMGRRRRSDEIRYWRESYDQGVFSPISNKTEAEEPILVDDDEGGNAGNGPQETPQPFLFELAGMKITQAASLETRVQRLEERLLHLERERMGSTRNFSRHSEDMQFQDSPRRASNTRSTSITRPQTDSSDVSLPRHTRRREVLPRSQQTQAPHVPAVQGSQVRSGSSRPSTISTHNSYHPSFDTFPLSTIAPSETPLPQQPSQTTNFARPLSTSTTIRGIPSSSPTFTKDGALTGEHYTALTNMILAEQVARQELESVVLTLQNQLRNFLVSNSARNYPPGDNSGQNQSAFEQDDSSDDGRFMQENEEVFQTPREEGQFGDDIFGDMSGQHNEEGVESTKGASRTLSLSRITLGKGMQHSVNF